MMRNTTTLIKYRKLVSVGLLALATLAAAPLASATPPSLQSLVLSTGGGGGGLNVPSGSTNLTVLGGTTATGGVRMSGAAAGDRLEVSLSSSNASFAPVPARVTLTLGQMGNAGGTFTIQTAAVTAVTQVTITAGTGAGAKTATLTPVKSLQGRPV